jgi:hypothetical protein
MTDELATVKQLIEAVLSRVERSAAQAEQFLKSWCRQLRVRDPGEWPTEFLMDLAAILELGQWQRRGDVPQALQSYPKWQVLLDELLSNAITQIENGVVRTKPNSSHARRSLFEVWSKEAVWCSSASAPMRLATDQQEDLLNKLAHFLWNNRHLSDGGAEMKPTPQPRPVIYCRQSSIDQSESTLRDQVAVLREILRRQSDSADSDAAPEDLPDSDDDGQI